MIRINMFSQADSVQGQGVGSAYKELIRLLRTRLVDEFYVTINKYGRSDLTQMCIRDRSYPGDNRLISPKSSHRRGGLAPRCRLVASWG